MLFICPKCQKEVSCSDSGGRIKECKCWGHPRECPSQFGESKLSKDLCKDCKEAKKQKDWQDKMFDGLEIS